MRFVEYVAKGITSSTLFFRKVVSDHAPHPVPFFWMFDGACGTFVDVTKRTLSFSGDKKCNFSVTRLSLYVSASFQALDCEPVPVALCCTSTGDLVHATGAFCRKEKTNKEISRRYFLKNAVMSRAPLKLWTTQTLPVFHIAR